MAQLDRPVRETPVGEQFGSLVDVETTHVDACDGGVSRNVATKDLVVEDPARDNRCHDSHHGQESVAHRLKTLL